MGIAERRQREKDARYKQIKNAAIHIFQEKGYDATTMNAVAKNCELSRASIYLYFKKKDDLFYAIVEPVLMDISKRLEKIASNEKESAVVTLQKMVDELFRDYDENQDIHRLVVRANMGNLPPDKRSHLADIIKSNIGHMQKAIQKGIDQGVFRKVNPRLTAIVILNSEMGINYEQSIRRDYKKSDYRKSTIDAAVELILNGLKSDTAG